MVHKMKRKKVGGFTLIELIVVIAILGVLMAIIVPNFFQYRETVQQQADETTIQSAVRAIQMIQATDGTVSEAEVEKYLEGDITTEQYNEAVTRANGPTPTVTP